MVGHHIIVIGGSAGSVEAVSTLVQQLPADLAAALFVVLHFPATSTSVLPRLLTRAGALPAHHAEDGEAIELGRIYVAPPDRHLLVMDDHVRVVYGPAENGHRPAIDPRFRSAALAHGPRTVGVVLSGMLDDGTVGLQAIKQGGGVAICQEPSEALYPAMPRNAMEQVAVDHVLPLAGIAQTLVQLSQQPVAGNPLTNGRMGELNWANEMAAFDLATIEDNDRPGTPSVFACPTCGGVLWEMESGDLAHYRCRVGHAFSPETLLAEQSAAVEEALWVALRALEERSALLQRMIKRIEKRPHPRLVNRYQQELQEAHQRATLLRYVLTQEQELVTSGLISSLSDDPSEHQA